MEATTIKLPATVTKESGRRPAGGRYALFTVTVLGVDGHGPTLAAARADATAQVSAIVAGASLPPAFARDDDGSLIVVVPHGSDTRTYRVGADAWRWTGSGGPETPDQRVATVWHWTAIAAR